MCIGDDFLGKENIWDIAEKYGTPVYIYDLNEIQNQINKLTIWFDQHNIAYCLKANPNKEVCSFISKFIPRCEISSIGELNIALNCGFNIKESLFTGPGKTREDLIYAIKNNIGLIVVESIEELNIIEEICDSLKNIQNVLIRINFEINNFEIFERMSGPSKFGIDFEDLILNFNKKNYKNINIIGLHMYEASGILDSNQKTNAIKKFYEKIIEFEEKNNVDLKIIDIGGGYGINYNKKYDDFDFSIFINNITEIFNKLNKKGVTILTEVGRYLVARSGHYIVSTIYLKKINDNSLIISNGGINHFFRQLITPDEHRIISQKKEGTKRYLLCGNLCTPLDIFGIVHLDEKPNNGDMFSIEDSGAYGFTLSPLLFGTHDIPKEIVIHS